MKHWHLFLFSSVFFSLADSAFANPQGSSVIAGQATVQQTSPQELQVTASDRAILHWQDFSIGAGETTRFIQPDSSSWVLNRVMSANPSEIFGSLQANGKVFLLNPNGLLVSENASIQTAGFTASTLEISDQEFLQKGDLHFKGGSQSAIINYGTIHAWDGDVVLLARRVENNGMLGSAQGGVLVAAAQEILLKPSGTERLFIQVAADKSGTELIQNGQIIAVETELKADGNPYSFAIQHTGSIDALTLVEKEGRVLLATTSGSIRNAGSISMQKGEVKIAADRNLLLDEGSSISAESGSIFLSAANGEAALLGEISNDNGTILEVRAPEILLGEKAAIRMTGGSQSIVHLESTAFDITLLGVLKAYDETRILINSQQDIKVGNGNQMGHTRIDSASGTIKLSAARDITITASKNRVAQITSQAPSGMISVEAGRDAFVTGGLEASGRAYVFSKGDLSFITGRHLMMKSNGDGYAALGAAQTATVIVDNLYSTPPQVGPGSLYMGPNTRLQGGELRVFTAKQSLNTIEGILNLVPFYPGQQYVESAEEVWGTYFSTASGGVPFTIFYKEIWVHPAVTDLFNIATSEFLQNLRYYDDFYYMPKTFCVRYMEKMQDRLRVKGSLFTPDILPNRCYRPLNEYYKNANGKLINLL